MAEFLALNSIDWVDFLHNSVRFCALHWVNVGSNSVLLDSSEFPVMILGIGDDDAIFICLTVSKCLEEGRLFSCGPKHKSAATCWVGPCPQTRGSCLCPSLAGVVGGTVALNRQAPSPKQEVSLVT